MKRLGSSPRFRGPGSSARLAHWVQNAFRLATRQAASAAGDWLLTPAVPAAPTDLVVTPESATEISGVFESTATNEHGFLVQRSADGSTGWTTVATLAPNILVFSNTGLTTATEYFYRVLAFNAVGNSAASNVDSATTL